MSQAEDVERAGMAQSGQAFFRLIVAAFQGALLYGLFRTAHSHVWPATHQALFVPAALIASFVPLVLISAAGNVRAATLLTWAGAASAILIGLGVHSVCRGTDFDAPDGLFALWLFTGAFLFIAHALIIAGDRDRRVFAHYTHYFDIAWKHIIQLALAGAFLAAFWLLFWLADALFQLIGLTLLNTLLGRAWFVIPASTLVVALALHVTDVHAGIVRGLRNLGLTLLSWLLIMMAALMVAFLLALPVTGLAPLFEQRSATSLLLVCSASLIVLINAAYQDGPTGRAVSPVLQYAGWAAVLVLLPMIALAGYALWLRIVPYGLTPDRVIAAAFIAVAVSYAMGYAVSLANPTKWLRSLEHTNQWTSLIVLAIFLALFSPLADPARLSVNDQLARLKAGTIAAEKFDYDFLRFRAGRYGERALKALAGEKTNPVIARLAGETLNKSHRYDAPKPPTPAELAARITVYPAGQTLPESFLNLNWSKSGLEWALPCLHDGQCEAFLMNLDNMGAPEIIIAGVKSYQAEVFQALNNNAWKHVGSITPFGCAGFVEALKAGHYKLEPAEFAEISIGGQRLRFEPRYHGCEDAHAAPNMAK